MRALRAYCLWCCLDQAKEVRLCPATSCPLWPWRMGKDTGEVPATTPADARSPAEPEIPTPQAGSRDGDAGAASETRPGRARLASVLLVGKFDADEPEPVDDESGDVPDAWPATRRDGHRPAAGRREGKRRNRT